MVMKEDITQQWTCSRLLKTGCGLVMKEDITQLAGADGYGGEVVVW